MDDIIREMIRQVNKALEQDEEVTLKLLEPLGSILIDKFEVVATAIEPAPLLRFRASASGDSYLVRSSALLGVKVAGQNTDAWVKSF